MASTDRTAVHFSAANDPDLASCCRRRQDGLPAMIETVNRSGYCKGYTAGRRNMSDDEIRLLHADIMDTVALERSIGAGKWRDIIKTDSIQTQRRFFITCAIQASQQPGGIYAIILRCLTSPLTLLLTNLDQLASPIVLLVHFIPRLGGFLSAHEYFDGELPPDLVFRCLLIPCLLIDGLGRWPLLLSCITVMAIFMAVQTALIYQVQYNTKGAHGTGIAAAAMLFIFQGAFTIRFQASVWVYPTEILSSRLRQRGSSVSTACNWYMNYMIVQITPVAIRNIGYKTSVIFAVLNGKNLLSPCMTSRKAANSYHSLLGANHLLLFPRDQRT